MRPAPFLRLFFVRLAMLLLLGLPVMHAMAQADPPGRVGRLSYGEGTVTFSPAGDDEWIDAEFNRPLTRGDKLWTDKGTRAEIQIGSAVVRMGGGTQLEVLTLDDQSVQLSATRGTVYVRVRSLPEGENFEIDTPNLAYRAAYPGDYRIDVDAAHGTTRVTIHSGAGAVYGDKGEVLPLGGGQQVTFRARSLAKVNTQESPPQDNFDRWAEERNRREDQSVAARYVPRDVVGYQLLDATGQWVQDGTHGAVWIPQNTPANWAPYRNGRWEWIAPWGWTWIDDAPWAFVTSHYGRWAQVGTRWAWVPGRMGLRPIYAPALVAFVAGTGAPGLAVGGKQTVAWFPLAPGEPWQPGFHATPLYISTVNTNMPPVRESGNYAYQYKAEALTAIPMEDFQRGKPSRGSRLRVAGSMLTQAQVVAPPPMPERSKSAAPARVAPAAADIRQVNSNAAAGQQPAEAQRQAELQRQTEAQRQAEAQREQAAKAEQAKAEQAKAEQARAVEQAQAAEQAKLAEQARRAEQAARKAEQQRLAEQTRRAEQQKLAEQAKAEQAKAEQAKADQAKADQAKADQAKADQARAVERAKAAEQAKLADQARRAEQAARKAEQQRLAEQTRRAEQQKLAEQARAAEQARIAQQARAAEQARIAEQIRIAQQARAAQETARREAMEKRAEQSKREQAARREQARREQEAAAQRAEQARREARAQAQRELQARRAEQAKQRVAAKKDEEVRRIAHAQQIEQARRAADHDAQVLREQRAQREEAARKVAEEKERAQREAWQRQQQALGEQWKRDQQAWEEQQRLKAVRQRPDLRRSAPAEPEVWQRGIPILNPGRTS
jgi:hypothetical protein